MTKYLFIGGSLHGEIHDIDPMFYTYRVALSSSFNIMRFDSDEPVRYIEPEYDTYEKRRINVLGNVIETMVHESITPGVDDNAIIHAILKNWISYVSET